jgi:hypothetical protein
MANVMLDSTLEVDLEEQMVLLWRREQFSRLGFDAFDARLLAESDADLGEARRLFASGCPLHLAFRILI